MENVFWWGGCQAFFALPKKPLKGLLGANQRIK